MSADDEARALLSEFDKARRMAVARFCRHWGDRVEVDDAMAFVDTRLMIYAGIIPTTRKFGKDTDAGKLPEWRQAASGKRDPDQYLQAMLSKALTNDLRDSVKYSAEKERKHLGGKPISISKLQEWRPYFDIPAKDNGIAEWNLYYADRFPYLTAFYRDDVGVTEMAKRFRCKIKTIHKRLDEEREQVRRELVSEASQ